MWGLQTKPLLKAWTHGRRYERMPLLPGSCASNLTLQTPMCNLYSLTRNPEAIIRLFRVAHNRAACSASRTIAPRVSRSPQSLPTAPRRHTEPLLALLLRAPTLPRAGNELQRAQAAAAERRAYMRRTWRLPRDRCGNSTDRNCSGRACGMRARGSTSSSRSSLMKRPLIERMATLNTRARSSSSTRCRAQPTASSCARS